MRWRFLPFVLGTFLAMGAGTVLSRSLINPIVDQSTTVLRSFVWLLPKPVPVEAPPIPESTRVLRQRSESVPSPTVSRPKGRRSEPKPTGGVLVRRNVVRAAVEGGIRPTASPVAATDQHPAGLVVYGWGAAGAGLADGDIITSVGGREPRSVDDVVIAVAGAYKGKSRSVSGRVWRNGQTLAVTVELPYLLEVEVSRDEVSAERSSLDQRSVAVLEEEP